MTTDNQLVKKSGRPSKLTPKLQETICEFVAAGNYMSTACEAAGISRWTYLNWLHRAEEEATNGGGVYFNFLNAVKKAEADAEAERVARIRKAGETNWLADMTHLERRHPDRWGKRERHQLDITETKTITITHVTVVKDYGERGPVIEGQARELLKEGKDAVDLSHNNLSK